MAFNTHYQKDGERMGHFAIQLTKLFKQAYSKETKMSVVLLQQSVTGLHPSISRQILLQKKPESLEQVIKEL